jgi:hypothetical protein
MYSFKPGIDWLAHFGGGLTGAFLVAAGLITAGLPKAGTGDVSGAPPASEKPAIRWLATLSGAALLVSILAAWATGRPWELLGRPPLERVQIPQRGISIELPHLVGPAAQQENETWTFGGLRYDPVAFVVVGPMDLSAKEAADPERTLQTIADGMNSKSSAMAGFSLTNPYAVAHRDGKPYLHGRQTAPDGRVSDFYTVLTGRQCAHVIAMATARAPASWKEAAAEVPFSLEFRGDTPRGSKYPAQ